MKNSKGILKQLGFSKMAEKVYFTLLTRGACSVSELAILTGYYRPAVYKSLTPLLTAGLIGKTLKGKRVLYKAESPALLAVLLKKQADDLESVLPTLVETFNNQDKKPKVSMFEGKNGITTLYEQLISTLPKNEVIYRYESPLDYSKNKRYYPAIYWKRAGSKGDIDKYVITNKKTYDKRRKNLNRFSKSIDLPFEDNITQIITKDRVAFIDYTTETGIIIENERFALFYQSIFKVLFKKL